MKLYLEQFTPDELFQIICQQATTDQEPDTTHLIKK